MATPPQPVNRYFAGKCPRSLRQPPAAIIDCDSIDGAARLIAKHSSALLGSGAFCKESPCEADLVQTFHGNVGFRLSDNAAARTVEKMGDVIDLAYRGGRAMPR